MGMHGSRYQDLDPSTLDTLTIRMWLVCRRVAEPWFWTLMISPASCCDYPIYVHPYHGVTISAASYLVSLADVM